MVRLLAKIFWTKRYVHNKGGSQVFEASRFRFDLFELIDSLNEKLDAAIFLAAERGTTTLLVI